MTKQSPEGVKISLLGLVTSVSSRLFDLIKKEASIVVDIRTDLLTFFQAALDSVEGRYVVAKVLPTILNQQLQSSERTDMQIVSIGKAAEAMLQGALTCLVEGQNDSLLISKSGHISLESHLASNITCIESAHPVPDKTSLSAGKKLIEFLRTSQAPCLFLISGGTSSLVEVLDEKWSLLELRELTQWMLANAYSIKQINAVRSSVSKIKAGGLWDYLSNRKVICLMISDVPQDDASVIGSGLLFPEKNQVNEQAIPKSLPERWKQKLSLERKPKAHPDFYSQIIATNKCARQAAAKRAIEQGYSVKTIEQLQEGNAVDVAKDCVQVLKDNPNTVIIWGAETTVVLSENPGVGGRNQHLALAAAIELEGEKNTYVLSAGTDGTDGLTDDAGAIVDGNTLARASLEGEHAEKSLRAADSGTYLCASGDLISTGITGTNVMDLIIGYQDTRSDSEN
ncbi:MAG: DUF4147 domain-containing protein [Thiotrichaceae bacterium]